MPRFPLSSLRLAPGRVAPGLPACLLTVAFAMAAPAAGAQGLEFKPGESQWGIGLGADVDGGFALCRELRSLSATLPIIFLTAISKEQRYIFRGYETGAVDYLFKPIEPEILRSKVRVFLELDRKNRSLRDSPAYLPTSEAPIRLYSSEVDADTAQRRRGLVRIGDDRRQ